MTILSVSPRPFRYLSGIGAELKSSPTTPYDNNPTLIQKFIERQVTNGRGYVHLHDSIDIVNRHPFYPKVSLLDVIENGLVSLELNGPLPEHYTTNPCKEISLGESYHVRLPLPSREPTLLEKIGAIQRRKFERMASSGIHFVPSF